MANAEINQYLVSTKLPDALAEFDMDNWTGSAFVSTRIKFSDLQAAMGGVNLSNTILVSTDVARTFSLLGDLEANQFAFKNNSGFSSLVINGLGDVYNNGLGGYRNNIFGFRSARLATGTEITAFGSGTLEGLTTGTSITAIGYNAGSLDEGLNMNTTNSESIFIGTSTKSKADGGKNETVIGFEAIGNGSSTVTIGNSEVLTNHFNASVIAKSDGSIDHGFLISDNSDIIKGGIAYDISLSSATIDLENSGGSFFSALDGFVFNRGKGNISTNTCFGDESFGSTPTGDRNSVFGFAAGKAITTAASCTLVGRNAGLSITTGTHNTFLGANAGQVVVSGTYNVGIGAGVFSTASMTGMQNIGIGRDAGIVLTSGDDNILFGYRAGNLLSTQSENVFIGSDSGVSNIGSGSVFLGNNSGAFETLGNKLFIDNQARADESDGRLSSLIYGVFDSTVANQRLTFNANVGVGGVATSTSTLNVSNLPTSSAGLVSGDVWNNSGVLTIV